MTDIQLAIRDNAALKSLANTLLDDDNMVAMFKQGMEGWSLYRRTGVPDNLYPAPGRPANYSNHNVPPFRSPYPDKERNLNNANCAPFDAEVVDNLWGKQMWWDTRTGVH